MFTSKFNIQSKLVSINVNDLETITNSALFKEILIMRKTFGLNLSAYFHA